MSESSAHRHHPLRPADGSRPAARGRAGGSGDAAAGEARLRALIEHSSEFIAVVDGSTRFVYANPAAQRVLGRKSADIVGIDWLTLVHPDDRTAAMNQLAACLRAPGAPVRIELRWLHDDGSWRTVVGTAVDLLDDPSVGGIVLNARDITDRLELEERLRQAEKMDAVGRLAGGVAHDFNNLLMVMGGNAEFLRARLATASLSVDEVTEIEEAIARGAALTRQLLAFSRKQPRSPRLVDLTAQVSGLEGMLRRLIGEDVPLRTALAAAPLPIRVDVAQLEQVVLNLVLNARDAVVAAQSDGQPADAERERARGWHGIEIVTRAVTLDAERVRRHPGLAPGEYAALVVRDTGVGMDAGTQARAFEPFFTTKPSGRGTGFGLATVYANVTQSGGVVEMESSVGEGSTFRALFPLAVGEVAPAPTRRGSGTELPRGTETILVVEDDDTVRTTVRRMLERVGYRVLEARHGIEALETCAAHPERGAISLVLTDVVMPEMGAKALIARLRERHPGLPVLLMSGYSDAASEAPELAGLGIVQVQKPVEPEHLARCVREVLDAARARAQ
jgi:two-component system, cell cycle sensor histidine kinase and response regulator CckA